MDTLNFKLLNNFQRNFPLASTPYNTVAERLGTSTQELFERLDSLKNSGAISRIGPVFRPNTVGTSTLCAMSVSPDKIQSVANKISSFVQVNHNYQRDHLYNLWFVVTACDAETLSQTLIKIEQKAGHSLLNLPLVKDYHIDLGFPMTKPESDTQPQSKEHTDLLCNIDHPIKDSKPINSAPPGDLVEAIQSGLPFVETPYKSIADSLGWSEQSVIHQIHHMLESGTIKRIGVIVRHFELGYKANAMVVWNVPDIDIDTVGKKMGRQDCVRLCYQRPRRLPDWHYNLFCMVHGKNREVVLERVRSVIHKLNLEQTPHEVLFSTKRFKQRGAHYRVTH